MNKFKNNFITNLCGRTCSKIHLLLRNATTMRRIEENQKEEFNFKLKCFVFIYTSRFISTIHESWKKLICNTIFNLNHPEII